MENTEVTLENLVTALGGTMPTESNTATEEQTVDTNAQSTPSTEPQTPAEPNTTPEPDPNPSPDPTENQNQIDENTAKAQQAFIHLRQQHKSTVDLLRSTAGLLNIDDAGHMNEQQLVAALQGRVVANQAKQNNVPVELMQRLNTLEQKDRLHAQAQRQQETAIGFQRVKDTFKLDQKALNTFAQDLINTGINPLEQSCDLVREYKIMHMDDMIAAAVDAAVKAEQARAAKAANQSSTPSNTTSGPSTTDQVDKITNVRDLEKWFRNQI